MFCDSLISCLSGNGDKAPSNPEPYSLSCRPIVDSRSLLSGNIFNGQKICVSSWSSVGPICNQLLKVEGARSKRFSDGDIFLFRLFTPLFCLSRTVRVFILSLPISARINLSFFHFLDGHLRSIQYALSTIPHRCFSN